MNGALVVSGCQISIDLRICHSKRSLPSARKLRQGNVLNLSVSHSVHRGVSGRHRHPRADTPSGQTPPGQAHLPTTARRLLQRTVRILLECILLFCALTASIFIALKQFLHIKPEFLSVAYKTPLTDIMKLLLLTSNKVPPLLSGLFIMQISGNTTSKATVLGRSQKLFLLPEGGSFPDKDNLIAKSITFLNMRSSIDITAFYSRVPFDDPRSVVNIVAQFLFARIYIIPRLY